MDLQDFYYHLPAIWLVFSGSYLSHNNAPVGGSDQREKSLIDLLRQFLQTVAKKSSITTAPYEELSKLLALWSDDLDRIYTIKQANNRYSQTKELAHHFLKRVQTFENYTIIPNGLISAKHTEKNKENISLAILKRQGETIDWIQIDPGSRYHSSYSNMTDTKSHAYLEITDIDPANITEEWLTLLIGLKAINPNGYYKDVSLYECLLAQLNGKTLFQSTSDEAFVFYSHHSPEHTWQVIEQTVRYLLQHLLGKAYQKTFWHLIIEFKLFLIEHTFTAYQNKENREIQQCHYLLHEMCQAIAQLTLKHGDQHQIKHISTRIYTIKETIQRHLEHHDLQLREHKKIGEPIISTFKFDKTYQDIEINQTQQLSSVSLQTNPIFVKPTAQENIIDYLKNFWPNFVNKLINSDQIKDLFLLTHGIETIFLEYFSNTSLLQSSNQEFSSDDGYLAESLKDLAETYYSCQSKLVNRFLNGLTYQPQCYAKNLILQFFTYAAIASLNLRHPLIGELLSKYKLCIAVSYTLSFNTILPYLVIDDPRWLKMMYQVKDFFSSQHANNILFSYEKFGHGREFQFKIKNDANENDNDVKFAYALLQKDINKHLEFRQNYAHLGSEKYNIKWQTLTYTDANQYLPIIYTLLSKTAHIAKIALTGFPYNRISSSWSAYQATDRDGHCTYWETIVFFNVSDNIAHSNYDADKTNCYVLNKIKTGPCPWNLDTDPYQSLIAQYNRGWTPLNIGRIHFSENEIIGRQHDKPATMARIHYLQLGFIQSESLFKIERLYIAIKNQQLDFTDHRDAILIKQALFETSYFHNKDKECFSILEWETKYNPDLIHQLGLLCIQKALSLRLRLTQHQAIAEILEVTLGLLNFYPDIYKAALINGINEIYQLLQDVLTQPPTHLSENTLLYLNAYLVISAQVKIALTSTEVSTLLTALLTIEKNKVNGLVINNHLLNQLHRATYKLSSGIEQQLLQNNRILNELMRNKVPQWSLDSIWKRTPDSTLYICGEHAIEPLLGKLYFQNRPMSGLPDSIIHHALFKAYFGDISFAVTPASQILEGHETACYLSVDRQPPLRLTLVNENLLIEEYVDSNYQRYIPPKQMRENTAYPEFIYEDPTTKTMLSHWWLDNTILIKNQQRQVIYQLHLLENTLFSLPHQGYVIPVNSLQNAYFRSSIQRFELLNWVMLITKSSSNHITTLDSLHFPRLGLDFDYKQEKFYSRQVHNYYLANIQQINTLHGFDHYLIIEKSGPEILQKAVKVIIPHHVINKDGSFYDKLIKFDFATIKTPEYFIYDLNPHLGLLKATNISAYLYLALLYLRSASHDDYDISHCNAYHLARENLENSWKDQPYDEVELDIVKQLLDVGPKEDLHHNCIALYFKVISLLCCSLRLAFLHTSSQALHNKEESEKILAKINENELLLPRLYQLYQRHLNSISIRVRLNQEEEQDIIALFSHTLPREKTKPLKEDYYKLFSRNELLDTAFLNIFQRHNDKFKFTTSEIEIDFNLGIHAILVTRFRLDHFVPLYKLAQSKIISLTKYRSLLLHLVLRAQIIAKEFPSELAMMLARVLLLVAEYPEQFPKPAVWLDKAGISINPFDRYLTYTKICQGFGPIDINYRRLSFDQISQARKQDDEEKERIWNYLSRYDLNQEYIPLKLPNNINFRLNYESHISHSNYYSYYYTSRRPEEARSVYLQAARNDAFYQFFMAVLQQCERLKFDSKMVWYIAPFTQPPCLSETLLHPNSPAISQRIDHPNLEQWAPAQEPIAELTCYFTYESRSHTLTNFPLSLFQDKQQGYQQSFYAELKSSWEIYHNENRVHYQWLSDTSSQELETFLKTKQSEYNHQVHLIWHRIEDQFKPSLETEQGQRFNLLKQSGQTHHYHKGDLLGLLITPIKLANYNETLIPQQEEVIKNLLFYIYHEINLAQINRLLTLLNEYKQAEKRSEQAALLQRLATSLQESIEPNSYRYPHWLLFQFENNILIRHNQYELILAMLGQNEKAMYQLNMGEGKSSVILPLLSYHLANSQQLLRINVLQSLLITMRDLLRQLFSGIIKKSIYTLPFYRDTDISPANLTLLLQALKHCQKEQHILLVTSEHRMCLQLKLRELVLENQQQIGATNIFNWETYRQHAHTKMEAYLNLTEDAAKLLQNEQDQCLKDCLQKEGYLDQQNHILKLPPRGSGSKIFARFKEVINDAKFQEWSCLKAAYRELIYNSQLAYSSNNIMLNLLHEINDQPVIDLLDESDEILKHGTELNYTVGDKYPFDGGELRWEIPQFFIEAIFFDSDIRDTILNGQTNGLTIVNDKYPTRGGVPYIQLLSAPYYDEKIKPLLINKFYDRYLPTFRKHEINIDQALIKGKSLSLLTYLKGKLSPNDEKSVLVYLSDKGQLKDIFLIAKGWLSHEVLFHIFNAKYRVKFGLDRKPIAIPFYGKDTPSPRSEFSNPDVMLGFTIISYLYQGLNQQQLKDSLQKLKDKYSHQTADKELQTWVKSSYDWILQHSNSFPLQLNSFENLDLADEQCLLQLHRYLAGNHQAILFYLNQFVLPTEALQYHYKMSANAHSLTGYAPAIGFSGTDDRKITMPFQVKSLRSDSQKGTNGKLLEVLTRPCNSQYHNLRSDNSNDLLEQLCQYVNKNTHCHIILDSGALITGLTNYQVADFLISNLSDQFQGLIYFSDEENQLTVLTREKKIIALQDCHINKSHLFAYLDDIHTRGTDLKLPLDCHGILTVGIGMPKDKLMQAAMRLRQLAQQQSISLWGSQEVTFAIARDNHIDPATITSLEVIKWTISNTLAQINADLFSVAVRKINFQFLQSAETLLKTAPAKLDVLINCCRERELITLEEFYALSPQLENLDDRLYLLVDERIKHFWHELRTELLAKHLEHTSFYENSMNPTSKQAFRDKLHTICREVVPYLQQGRIKTALENDEEKEVEVEIIQEQNIVVAIEKRDPRTETDWYIAWSMQDNFIDLAKQQGILMPIKNIHNAIQTPQLKQIIWHEDIYLTVNFTESVNLNPSDTLDSYLRLVDAVLIHRTANKSSYVVLSGNEAARIKQRYSQSMNQHLLVHLYDINGPTQLPNGSPVTPQEQKLLTIIKLFAGDCNYETAKETQRLAKRVGRLHPNYFVTSAFPIDSVCSHKLYDQLFENGYLNYAGLFTEKLLKFCHDIKNGETPRLELADQYNLYHQHIQEKLYRIYTKLIVQPSAPLSSHHHTLWQWICTRGRLKEYPGSELESILNSELSLKL